MLVNRAKLWLVVSLVFCFVIIFAMMYVAFTVAQQNELIYGRQRILLHLPL